jgi:hypothetical protein
LGFPAELHTRNPSECGLPDGSDDEGPDGSPYFLQNSTEFVEALE